MKKKLAAFCVLIFLAAIAIALPTSAMSAPPSAQSKIKNFLGNWEFSECWPTIDKSATNCVVYSLRVSPMSEAAIVDIDINGYMSSSSIRAEGKLIGNALRVTYVRDRESGLGKVYENGDILFELSFRGDKLYTTWVKLKPALTKNQKKCACFSKVVATSPVWVVSWAASQQIPEPQNALPSDDLRDANLMQIFHLSLGGSALRIHISNAFGAAPLHLSWADIGHPFSWAKAAIDPVTAKPLTFAGRADVTIPPGAEFLSDPVETPVPALSDIAVTIHYDEPPARQTSHPGSRATSYLFQHPAELSPATNMPKEFDHWFQVSAIDVLATAPAAAIVALGDSITDGHGATTNGNDRWTDILAARLNASAPDPRPQTPDPMRIGVANAGIGGNHLLTDGLGPNALARFDRDVLAQSGVRYLIVFEGVNDLGGLAIHGEVPATDHDALVARVIAAYQQIIARAHAHGLIVIGATITPYVGSAYYHPGPLSEADRQAVNNWIREAGIRTATAGNQSSTHFEAVPHFDAVLDFDAVVRDPAHPDQLLPAYDCGDHLHPSPAGYRAIANSIPLTLFAQ
jgi:lysophospholipase L1-like esterase